MQKRVFSGIQPTGKLTLGNYLGAIKNWVLLQQTHECIFCIVDLHAITVHMDPKELYDNIIDNLALYMACGIDVKRSIIFNQSRIAAHSELAWILGCATQLGWLNRMTQFKDKAGKDKQQANLGLYAYPTLMAADILLYKADLVPVGEDQVQHIELTRDIAGSFNRKYGVDYFTLPEFVLDKNALRIMSLRDGTKKMSKSDPSDMSRINLTDTAETIVSKFQKAKSDSIDGIYVDTENRPEISNLINIAASLKGCSTKDIENEYSALPTSVFKSDLADLTIAVLAPIQQEMRRLLQDKGALLKMLDEQALAAAEIANITINQVRKIVGLA